jgi:hypothetical protein
MKKILLFIVGLIAIVQLQAQNGVAISTSSSATPDGSAILDVQSTSQGMLIPRLDIANLSTAAPVTSPATGLMAYNTNTTTGPGFFYWDGSAWTSLGGGAEELDDLSDVNAPGNYNLYIGKNAGNTNTAGFNVSLGEESAKVLTGQHNVLIGVYAGLRMTSGSSNTFVGKYGGEHITTGSDNIGIGKDVLNVLTTGHDNLMFGLGGGAITTGSQNIIIGVWETKVPNATGDNQLNINNTICATDMRSANVKVGIGNNNNAPNSTLDVAGSVSKSIVTKTGTYTATDQDYTILFDISSAATCTLPDANGRTGRIYVIRMKKVSSTSPTLTINTSGGSIYYRSASSGASSIHLGWDSIDERYYSVTLQSDGTDWIVISDVSVYR